jgi:non-specific protein-tyrosine kinase
LLLLGGTLAAAASYFTSSNLPKVYEARTKLELSPGDVTRSGSDYSQIQGLTGLVRTYTELVKTRPVLEAASLAGSLDLSYEDLSPLITVTQIPNTQMLQIAARANDPRDAANLAELVSTAFMRQVQDMQARRYADAEQNLRGELDQANGALAQRLASLDDLRAGPSSPERDSQIARAQIDITQLQQTYQNAARSYSDFRLAQARGQDLFTVVEPAAPVSTPVEPRMLLNVSLAAFVGLLVALGAAYAAERLDDRVFSAERLARQAGIPVLAAVAKQPGRGLLPQLARHPVSGHHAADANANVAIETFLLLFTNLRFLGIEKPVRTLLVTSSDTGDGKTSTATNLAIAAAQSGDSVLLVDADLRRPAVHDTFGTPNTQGLTTLLLDDELDAASIVRATDVPGLRLLTSGPVPPNPGQLLASRQMGARFPELAALADVVIFDSPPLLAVSDSVHLAGRVDGVVLVVDTRRARGGRVAEAVHMLHSVRARVLGAVLNQLPTDSATYSGYYGYARTDAAPDRRPIPPTPAVVDGRPAAAPVGTGSGEPA